jgi:DNA repair exonuclease SbcCD ATPase subunit
MKIKSVQLKNFKRFTDLTIDNIPENTKLVLLIGANGSGKSSLFDGFRYATFTNNNHQIESFFFSKNNNLYFRKNPDMTVEVSIDLFNGEKIHKLEQHQHVSNNPDSLVLRKKFIGRSSTRIVPKITNQANLTVIDTDGDGPAIYTENDTRFINDVFSYIQQINKALREPAFKGESANTYKIFQEYIEPLNSSLKNIFGNDDTIGLKIGCTNFAKNFPQF